MYPLTRNEDIVHFRTVEIAFDLDLISHLMSHPCSLLLASVSNAFMACNMRELVANKRLHWSHQGRPYLLQDLFIPCLVAPELLE